MIIDDKKVKLTLEYLLEKKLEFTKISSESQINELRKEVRIIESTLNRLGIEVK